MLAALLAVMFAVHAPSLRIGWFGDDFAHRRFILDHLQGLPSSTAWWNMFDGRAPLSASAPDPSTLFGRLPWWAAPDFSFALLRPLSTASHFLDYLLWPESPAAMHAHNIAWFVVLVALAAIAYFRIFGPNWVAVLALAMLAIDDANTTATAWIASRNTLLTAVAVLGTLLAYDRGVHGSPRARHAAPLLLLCAHACSEGAIAAWAYLFAYAVALDARPARERWLSLAPMAAVSAAWIALGSILGYGVHGSGWYVDPRVDPGLFARALLERFPALLELQLAVPREYGTAWPHAMYASQLYLALLLVAAAWAMRRSREVAFFLLATLLSLVPQVAAGSLARLLLISSFAAHGLTASVFTTVLRASAPRLQPVAVALGGIALGFVHGWVALVLPPSTLQFTQAIHQSVWRAASSLPTGAALERSTILVLHYPDYLRSVFVGLYRNELFAPGPRRMHVLGVGSAPVRLTRSGPDAIELEPTGGYLLDPTTTLVRRTSERFLPGQTFELGEAQVEVRAIADDGRPARVGVRSALLERDTLLWVSWNDVHQRFDRITLPALGQSLWLATK